ncbi:MAG TPA: hypothetical protein VFP54_08985 [Acidimicrobiales bacterium]|nr:hypothetical protein [Acidimicrobiales bacterium]
MATDRLPQTFTISCTDCTAAGTKACDDCVVSFIVGRQPDDALVIDVAEERAVRMLGAAGLVPGLRHVPRTA